MSRDWPVYWFEDIDSTNEEARRRAAGVASVQGQWIAAKRQSAGRGRLHRTWTTIDGNLFATALFSWENPFADAVRIPFAAGLAVVDACRRFAPRADLHLKWPNDVRAAGAKVAGILVETGGATTPWVAVGIGVNVAAAPDLTDQKTASLAALRGDSVVDAPAVLDALRTAFARRLTDARAGPAFLKRDWLPLAEGFGEQIRVRVGDRIEEGVFSGLDDDGGLVLQSRNGEVRTIRAGDVELLKET